MQRKTKPIANINNIKKSKKFLFKPAVVKLFSAKLVNSARFSVLLNATIIKGIAPKICQPNNTKQTVINQ